MEPSRVVVGRRWGRRRRRGTRCRRRLLRRRPRRCCEVQISNCLYTRNWCCPLFNALMPAFESTEICRQDRMQAEIVKQKTARTRTTKTHQIGSVTISTNGLLRLTLSSGQNAFFSSNLLHHLGSPVSFLNFAALLRNKVGP